MQDNIQDIIKSRLSQLPPDLRQAITAADLPMKFDEISKKFGLRIDQSGYLQTETVLVMLGLEKSEDFMDNLATNAEMSRELAKSIADEVGTQIFSAIRTSLREMESTENEIETNESHQETDLTMNKEHILNSIETAGEYPHASIPINVLTPVTITPASPQDSAAPTIDMDLPMIVTPSDTKTVSGVTAPKAPATASPTPAMPAAPSPLITRLMTTPTASANEKVEKKVMPAPIAPSSRPGGDPYREPLD